MIFERIEDPGLSQYAYIVGCAAAREVAVVDPRRDVDVFVDWAARNGVRIAHVLETHIHADFASGALELAERTGAALHLSAYDEGEVYDVAFPHRPMADGDAIRVGNVRIEALHTPGHTPEHLAFLVYDLARTAEAPMAMLSGDFLFVGSVGRPDLLGEEAKAGLAARQFASVQRLADLPDGLEIHPAHGAGSMCGAGMSGRPFSTLGYERLANPYLDPDLTPETFACRLLGSSPPFPPYYRRMKRLNSEGPPILGGLPGIDRPLAPDEVERRAAAGAVVVDARGRGPFAAGHIPGALGIGLDGSTSMWASWLVPYDRPIVLVASSARGLELVARALVRVGLDSVEGYLDGGMDAWAQGGRPVEGLTRLAPAELARRLEDGEPVLVLDVRSDDEFAAGHVPGALHVMAGHLGDGIEEVPDDGRTIVVVCRTDYRSTAAASVLLRAGIPAERVANVAGGMTAWRAAGLPETTGA